MRKGFINEPDENNVTLYPETMSQVVGKNVTLFLSYKVLWGECEQKLR